MEITRRHQTPCSKSWYHCGRPLPKQLFQRYQLVISGFWGCFNNDFCSLERVLTTVLVKSQVEFSPTLGALAVMVNILPRLITTVAEFKRLPELLNCKQSQRNPIHVNIGNSSIQQDVFVAAFLFSLIYA